MKSNLVVFIWLWTQWLNRAICAFIWYLLMQVEYTSYSLVYNLHVEISHIVYTSANIRVLFDNYHTMYSSKLCMLWLFFQYIGHLLYPRTCAAMTNKVYMHRCLCSQFWWRTWMLFGLAYSCVIVPPLYLCK